MIEKYLRPFFQKLLVDPVAKWLISQSIVHPSHFTFLGCFVGIAGSALVGLGWKWESLGFILFSGYMDSLDGTLARFKNQMSPFGASLDIVCDRIVEFSIIFGFYILHKESFCSLFMLGSILICVTSFLVVGIFSENASNKSFFYSPGLIERGEAFFFFSLMIIFPFLFTFLAYAFSLLVFLTAAIRLFQFYQMSREASDR